MYRRKIPKEMKFLYDETLKKLEVMINNNETEKFSQKSIRELILLAPHNKEIQELSSKVLSKQFKGMTTEHFLEDLADTREVEPIKRILSGYETPDPEDQEKMQAWLKTRTMAYLESIGKVDDKLQQDLLMRLEKQYLEENVILPCPQYVRYNDLYNNENYVIVSNNRNGFKALDKSTDTEYEENIIKQQNKGKKGLRALFKSKKNKELITNMAVLNEEGDVIQALNRYETGRLELVTIRRNNAKMKVVNKADIEPQDIGNNGAIKEYDKSFAPKIDLKQQTKVEIPVKEQNVQNNEYDR